MKSLTDFTGEVLPKVVSIVGVDFKLQEFPMRLHAAWMDVVDEYDLPAKHRKLVQEVLPTISNKPNEIRNHPRIKSLNDRRVKISKRHEELMGVYGTEEEPATIDDDLSALVDRMADLDRQIEVTADELLVDTLEETGDAESLLQEYQEQQDEARLFFAWKVATATGRTELDWSDWQGTALGSDYQAAEEWIKAGNAGWAARQTTNRPTK